MLEGVSKLYHITSRSSVISILEKGLILNQPKLGSKYVDQVDTAPSIYLTSDWKKLLRVDCNFVDKGILALFSVNILPIKEKIKRDSFYDLEGHPQENLAFRIEESIPRTLLTYIGCISPYPPHTIIDYTDRTCLNEQLGRFLDGYNTTTFKA